MNHAIILAGGTGTRMGQDVPKQFLCVDNKPIIMYTLENFQQCNSIDTITISCLEGWEPIVQAYALQFSISKLIKVVPGGKNRQESLFNAFQALKSVASVADTVVVSDANRPMIDPAILDTGTKQCQITGVASGVTPCFDSMFKIDSTGAKLTCEVNRSELVHGTGPEVITYDILDTLLQKYQHSQESLTLSQMCLLEGISVSPFYTSNKCIKITTTEDIETFKALLHSEKYSWLK